MQTFPKAAFTKAMQEFCNGAEHTRINVEHDKGKYSKAPAWRFIKSGQFGQNGQPFQTILGKCENCIVKNSNRENKVSKPCLDCLEPKERRVCGNCQKWLTGACNAPGTPNNVPPLNLFARTCQGFILREDLKT